MASGEGGVARGSGEGELSIVNGQWSIVNCQLSIVNGLLFGGELPEPLVGLFVGFDAELFFGAAEGGAGEAGGIGGGQELGGGLGAGEVAGEEVDGLV